MQHKDIVQYIPVIKGEWIDKNFGQFHQTGNAIK